MDCRIIKKIEKMKKYITTVTFAKITVFVFTLFSTIVSAQTALRDAPVDEPAGPVDGYVLVLAILGLVYVFLRLRAYAFQGNTLK
jgi:hypothetical protein